MKTLGLLGGMSWESTQLYYQLLNQEVYARLGGLHSASLILHSVDFATIEVLQHQGEWEQLGELLGGYSRGLEQAGAQGLIICTNTMHKVADRIQAEISIPLLHIADGTADAIINDGRHKIGLLGTAFTMEQSFYIGRLQQRGIEVLVPNKTQRQQVHQVIYQELCQGQCLPVSRQAYLDIIGTLVERGAEGVILGCTEIGMLLRPSDTDIPLYDTTRIHGMNAIDWALSDSGI